MECLELFRNSILIDIGSLNPLFPSINYEVILNLRRDILRKPSLVEDSVKADIERKRLAFQEFIENVVDDSSKQDPIVIDDVVQVKEPIIELDASSSSSDFPSIDSNCIQSDIEDITVAVASVIPVPVVPVHVAPVHVAPVHVAPVVLVREDTNMEFSSSPDSNSSQGVVRVVSVPVVPMPVVRVVTEVVPIAAVTEIDVMSRLHNNMCNVSIPNTKKPYMCYMISTFCLLFSIESYHNVIVNYETRNSKKMFIVQLLKILSEMSKNYSEDNKPLKTLQETRKVLEIRSNNIMFKANEYLVRMLSI